MHSVSSIPNYIPAEVAGEAGLSVKENVF